MTAGLPSTQPYAGVFAALNGFSKSLPSVDPGIFRIQEIIGSQLMAALEPLNRSAAYQIQTALGPFVQSINVQLEAAAGVSQIQRQVAHAIAPAMAAMGQLRLPDLSSVAGAMPAMDFAVKLPDLSVLGQLGQMAVSGGFAPEFVQTAHDAVDAVSGYSDEISTFLPGRLSPVFSTPRRSPKERTSSFSSSGLSGPCGCRA